MTLSNSQITQLGERLRNNHIQDGDLAKLDEFRQTYSDIDEQAYRIIRAALESSTDVVITKRKRKTQQSIVDKLRREKNLRLPQMQDIAGCRIVVQGGIHQAKQINALLVDIFEKQQWRLQSKERDTDGYRAIHIIVKMDKKFYEIQLRTFAQDLWANIVESASDKDNTLKYGGREDEQPLVARLSQLADRFFTIDKQAHTFPFDGYQQQIEEAINNVLSH